MNNIHDDESYIEEKFIEIIKNITKKELQEFETAAKCGKNAIKCDDQFAAIIEITQSEVDCLKNDFTNPNRKNEQGNYQKDKFPTIVLVLESPHKREFNLGAKTYYGPAMGKTGENLEKYLAGNIAKYMCINDLQSGGAYFLKDFKIQPGKYRVYLVNSIQYQCSLGVLEKKKHRIQRDQIFTEMFEDSIVNKNFIDRLKCHSPQIIINCCTKGETNLQGTVQKAIDSNFPQARKLIGNHPSSAFFCHGFQDA